MEEIKEASLPIEDNIPSEEPIIELNKVAMEYYMQTEKIDNMKEFFIRLVKGKIKKMKKRILEEITFLSKAVKHSLRADMDTDIH